MTVYFQSMNIFESELFANKAADSLGGNVRRILYRHIAKLGRQVDCNNACKSMFNQCKFEEGPFVNKVNTANRYRIGGAARLNPANG